MALIVTTFAMAGSRISITGGLFACVKTAFGPDVGFLAGTPQWIMSTGTLQEFAATGGTLVVASLLCALRRQQQTPDVAVVQLILLVTDVDEVRPGGRHSRFDDGHLRQVCHRLGHLLGRVLVVLQLAPLVGLVGHHVEVSVA